MERKLNVSPQSCQRGWGQTQHLRVLPDPELVGEVTSVPGQPQSLFLHSQLSLSTGAGHQHVTTGFFLVQAVVVFFFFKVIQSTASRTDKVSSTL